VLVILWVVVAAVLSLLDERSTHVWRGTRIGRQRQVVVTKRSCPLGRYLRVGQRMPCKVRVRLWWCSICLRVWNTISMAPRQVHVGLQVLSRPVQPRLALVCPVLRILRLWPWLGPQRGFPRESDRGLKGERSKGLRIGCRMGALVTEVVA